MSDEAPTPNGETDAPRRFADIVCEDGNAQMIALIEQIIAMIRDNLVIAVDIIVTDLDGDPVLGHCSLSGVPTTLIVGGFEMAKQSFIQRSTASNNDSVVNFARIIDKILSVDTPDEAPEEPRH
jgi:hypothetical protein